VEGEYPYVVKKDISGDTTLCVQAYYFSKYLGDLRVMFDDFGKPESWGGNPILLDNSVAKGKL